MVWHCYRKDWTQNFRIGITIWRIVPIRLILLQFSGMYFTIIISFDKLVLSQFNHVFYLISRIYWILQKFTEYCYYFWNIKLSSSFIKRSQIPTRKWYAVTNDRYIREYVGKSASVLNHIFSLRFCFQYYYYFINRFSTMLYFITLKIKNLGHWKKKIESDFTNLTQLRSILWLRHILDKDLKISTNVIIIIYMS